jgi:hypothetical protein
MLKLLVFSPMTQPKKMRLAGSPTLATRKFSTHIDTPNGAKTSRPVMKALCHATDFRTGGGMSWGGGGFMLIL